MRVSGRRLLARRAVKVNGVDAQVTVVLVLRLEADGGGTTALVVGDIGTLGRARGDALAG
jgi:hypothetical protein